MADIPPNLESPRTNDEDVRRQFEASPTQEIKELLEWNAVFPVEIAIGSPIPLVITCTANETRDYEKAINVKNPAWSVVASLAGVVDDVGAGTAIRISAIDGLVAGTQYDIKLHIVGARS